MITEPYRTLAGFEQFGDGSLGLRIEIAGSPLPELTDALRDAGRKALDAVKEEIIAAMKASDPDAQARTKAEREELLGCFDGSIYVEEIPNGYCRQGCCRHLPWFIVTTAVGRIKIGWRKRVIEIDWTDTRGATDSDTLFPGEAVTKGARSIHAWSVEKAREYVTKIVSNV